MTLTTSQRPRALVARRFGRSDFERLDHLPTASLGYREVEKVKVDCRFRLSKSKWGVLGDELSPAGIIYMDLSFDQPKECRLSSATVLVTLEEYLNESDDARVPAVLSSSLQVTDRYGPKQLSGEQKTMPVKKIYHFTPTVNALGNGGGGVGVDTEKTITYVDRWIFTGQLLPGKSEFRSYVRGTTYRTIKWELTENDLESRSVHTKSIHTGFAFQHEGKPFYIRVEINGKLQKVTDRMKKYLKFPSNRQKKEASTLTLVDLGIPGSFEQRLDTLADSLPRAMEMENLMAVPMEMPDALPASFQDVTRQASASNDLADGITSGTATLVQDPPAISSAPSRDGDISALTPLLQDIPSMVPTDPALLTIENLARAIEVYSKSDRNTTEIQSSRRKEATGQKANIKKKEEMPEEEVQTIQETLQRLSKFRVFLLLIRMLEVLLNLLQKTPSFDQVVSPKDGQERTKNADKTKRIPSAAAAGKTASRERDGHNHDVDNRSGRRTLTLESAESMTWKQDEYDSEDISYSIEGRRGARKRN